MTCELEKCEVKYGGMAELIELLELIECQQTIYQIMHLLLSLEATARTRYENHFTNLPYSVPKVP